MRVDQNCDTCELLQSLLGAPKRTRSVPGAHERDRALNEGANTVTQIDSHASTEAADTRQKYSH